MTLKTGDKAYFDTFNGLIPVKVTAIRGPKLGIASTLFEVDFEITTTVAAYKKGEKLTRAGINVIPRGAIKKGTYSQRIWPYYIQPDITGGAGKV